MNYKDLKNNFINKCLSENEHAKVSDYSVLLEPVIEYISDDIDKSRENLFNHSKVQESIKKFVDEQKLSDGLVISFGTKNYTKTVSYGLSKSVALKDGQFFPCREKMKDNSIFDLASVSKVITCYTIMKLYELKRIDIDLPISVYDKRFNNIQNHTLRQLLSFQIKLTTQQSIVQPMTLVEAEKQIFNITASDIDNRPYSDMGSIVSKYVVESALNESFINLVKKYILIPLGMNNTFTISSVHSKQDFACNNYERKILSDKCIVDVDTEERIVHDYKAKILGHKGDRFSGHAGLFSTANDMCIFARNILSFNVMSPFFVKQIIKNYVGFKDENNQYSQYLGMLCHTKHPNPEQSEVYHLLSDNAVAQGGYTGTYFSYDIDNEVFMFLGANRCHNRITYISNSISNANIVSANEWKKMYIDTHKYAWQRDVLIHNVFDLCIQYRFLEYLFENK